MLGSGSRLARAFTPRRSLMNRRILAVLAVPGLLVCEDLGSQECTQEWRKSPFDERVCAQEVWRGCVNPNFKLP
jgi:hypothetical protein